MLIMKCENKHTLLLCLPFHDNKTNQSKQIVIQQMFSRITLLIGYGVLK